MIRTFDRVICCNESEGIEFYLLVTELETVSLTSSGGIYLFLLTIGHRASGNSGESVVYWAGQKTHLELWPSRTGF